MNRYRIGFYILLGIVIGVACAPGKGPAAIDTLETAHSSTASDCAQWDFQLVADSAAIPAGWEPFSWQYCAGSYQCLALRKCAD